MLLAILIGLACIGFIGFFACAKTISKRKVTYKSDYITLYIMFFMCVISTILIFIMF